MSAPNEVWVILDQNAQAVSVRGGSIEIAKSVAARYQKFEQSPYTVEHYVLAARVRELEAERDKRTERDATVRDLIKRLRERAERAEAALAEMRASVDRITTEECLVLRGERDALRALLRECESRGINDADSDLLMRLDDALEG